jgi:hypothetical protein
MRFAQKRYATRTNVGVHTNIIPNTIAWIVVIGSPRGMFPISCRSVAIPKSFNSQTNISETKLSPFLGLIVAALDYWIVIHNFHTRSVTALGRLRLA